MEPSWLERQVTILKGIHVSFILTLFLTGSIGLGLFGFIVSHPMRTCPVIYAIYITFWLCLGLAILEVVLALCFFGWFLFSIYNNSVSVDDIQNATPKHMVSQQRTPRQVADALGQHCHVCTRSSVVSATSGSHISINRSQRSESCKSSRRKRHCQSHVGWLCIGGLFLAFLSTGLILGLVLVVGHINYFNTSFLTDITSVFIEARIGFHSSSPLLNNAFICWDKLQRFEQCCGLREYSDWLNRSALTIESDQFPPSCSCRTGFPGNCVDTNNPLIGRVYRIGCLNSIQRHFNFNLKSTQIWLAVVLCVLVITFLLDLFYTLFVAHTTLSHAQHNSPERSRQFSIPAPTPN